jgi:methionyl-tRNA synthetase
MHQLIDTLYVAGTLYQPILVHTAPAFFKQLGVSTLPTLSDLNRPNRVDGLVLDAPVPLFPRLDPLIEVPWIQSAIIKK